MAIKNGSLPEADDVMNAMGSLFNDVAQNLFNADYIGFDSRLTNSTTPNLKNVKYSTFTSDDADTNYGFFYNASTDLYETQDLTAITEYIIIEATSISSPINQNNVKSLQIGAGKWLIYCSTGTDAVHRAQIIRTLFYDNRIGNFTTVTSVQTSHANDVGKRAHKANTSTAGLAQLNYTGTFVNTATNTNCSSWSNVTPGHYDDTSNWEMPSATVLNSSGNELGTDMSADELSNPATCDLEVECSSTGGTAASVGVVILCVGDITWAGTGTNTDYFTDDSIPDMIAAGTLEDEGATPTSTLIFKDTVISTNNAIPVINSTIDATSSQVISVSANGGSNWTTVNNAEIARPTAGTELWRKIVITRTDLSKEDTVTEQAVKYSLY